MNTATVRLRVWGDLACFTRPENKVERVSYDVLTPSAARAILECIYWKPQIGYRIREIAVMKPVKRFSITRNEVKSVATPGTVKAWAEKGGGYSAEDDRTQRHAVMLRDVEYIIEAEIYERHPGEHDLAKHVEMFNRRAEKGQCFQQPYLGTRECAAFFEVPSGDEVPHNLIGQLGGEYAENAGQLSLGRMLFDLQYREGKKGAVEFVGLDKNGKRALKKADVSPLFFEAVLTDGGRLRVPEALYQKLQGGAS